MATAQQALVMISAGSAPPAASTWNPLDKDSEITLSGSDLIASHPSGSGFKSVRGTLSKSSGLRYFTATIVSTTGGLVVLGIADAAATLSLGYIGQHTSGAFKKSAGIWSSSTIYYNLTGAASTASSTGYANGAVIGVLVNWATFTLSFYNDATGALLGSINDGTPWPAFFPAVSLYVGGSVSTLNCSGPFTNLPSGATAWDS